MRMLFSSRPFLTLLFSLVLMTLAGCSGGDGDPPATATPDPDFTTAPGDDDATGPGDDDATDPGDDDATDPGDDDATETGDDDATGPGDDDTTDPGDDDATETGDDDDTETGDDDTTETGDDDDTETGDDDASSPSDADSDGYTPLQGDCDDSDPDIHPGATEVCNQKDDSCNGQIDEGVQTPFHPDVDRDTFGDPAVSTQACTAPSGYVADATDCDDTRSSTHPGATEICDDRDNDCDTQIDEGLFQTWYTDADQDDHGDPDTAELTCDPAAGSVLTGDDCDDGDPSAYPGAGERVCSGADEDCDPDTDDHPDTDQDGYDLCAPGVSGADGRAADCDDIDPAVHPGVAETGDGIDSDCDGDPDTITTVVGNGLGDGDPATRAQLLGPRGVAMDTAGNLYVCDTGFARVRRISSAGVISTYAGGGSDSPREGGPATSSYLSMPVSVVIDGAGDLLISDYAAAAIYRVDASSRNITRIVGGEPGYNGDGIPASTASLFFPAQIALDAQGNLYIADSSNHRIRRVAASSGLISTVAGTGNPGSTGDNGAATLAQLYGPEGVAVDAQGTTIYIADSSNNVIRKVSGGTITRAAGTGQSGASVDSVAATQAKFNYPTALALSGAGALYIADHNNFVVRVLSGGTVTRFAGGGSAPNLGDGGPAASSSLFQPNGLAIDAAGNLLIGDQGNDRVRRVSASSSQISTIAGGFIGDGGPATAAMLAFPSDTAIDAQGNLYIADARHYRVRKVAPNGTISTVAGNGYLGTVLEGQAATLSALSNPVSVAVDTKGDLYIGNSGSILRVRKSDGVLDTVAGQTGHGYAGDGGPASAAQFSYIAGLGFNAAGDLYVADQQNHAVRRIAAGTGTVSTVAGTGTLGYSGDGGPATQAKLCVPNAVGFDAAGNLYIADAFNSRVRRVSASTQVITTVAGGGESYDPDVPATSARLNIPYGIALDGAGALYIANNGTQEVLRVSPTTGILTSIAGEQSFPGFDGDGGPASESRLHGPRSLTFDPAGNLYIVDEENHRIRRITPP